jgi:cation:H+ antiporter
MSFFLILAGTLLLYLGAEGLILGGGALALRFGLPTLVIGLVIIGFGTSAPEMVVSVQASVAGKGDISLGNVIGSNIANTGLILGLAAILQPIKIHKRLFQFDTPIMILTGALIFGIYLATPIIGRVFGGVLFGGILLYTAWSIYHGKKHHVLENELSLHPMRHWSIEIGAAVMGLILLVLGGKLFLDGAIELAKIYDISDRVIGLTIVAVGTSLPELATTLVATFRKQGDMAIGNVVGSNIFNSLGIVGIAALISPIEIEAIQWTDIAYMISLYVGLWLIIKEGTHIARWEGGLMLGSYFVYVGYLLTG